MGCRDMFNGMWIDKPVSPLLGGAMSKGLSLGTITDFPSCLALTTVFKVTGLWLVIEKLARVETGRFFPRQREIDTRRKREGLQSSEREAAVWRSPR